jgi:hypothetical protein
MLWVRTLSRSRSVHTVMWRTRKMLLNKAVDQKKDDLKVELFKLGYHTTPDGKQLVDLTLTELEQIYENERFRANYNK